MKERAVTHGPIVLPPIMKSSAVRVFRAVQRPIIMSSPI